VAISDTWSVAGWSVTIVQIAPNAVFTPPALADGERQVVKIFRGSLIDVNYNGILKDDGHWHTYTVTTPNRAIPLFIDSSVTEITAGEDGAVISYWTVSEETLKGSATDMTASPVTDLSGPFMENLEWKITADLFGSTFDGVEFYNLAAINIQENDGSRLMNMQWWTFREDFNTDAYHNQHPDFGEIHMTMYAASGTTGMRTTLPYTENLNWVPNPDPTPANSVAYIERDQTEVQIVMPMPPGYAHGPLWSVDPSTGEPTLDCEGQAQYPFHGWFVDDAGAENDPLRYALWVAFEHPLEDVVVPTEMMTEWPNSNLQTTMTAEDCAAASGDDAVAGDGSEPEDSTETVDESETVDENETADETDSEEVTDSEETDTGGSSSPAVGVSAFIWAISFAFVFCI
jgi:hypothetical protein